MKKSEADKTEEESKSFPAGVCRIIGIQHRVKFTKDGESHPTRVFILKPDGSGKLWELLSEDDELDFIRGKWPTGNKYREAKPDEDFSFFLSHHIRKEDEEEAEKEGHRPRTMVPVAYEGLQGGDIVAMILGGSGNRLAHAISRFGEQKGFSIKRIAPYRLKEKRPGDKSLDAKLMAELLRDNPELFWDVLKIDREVIKLQQVVRLRRNVQDQRKAFAQQVQAWAQGEIFCREDGGFPDGTIKAIVDAAIANDSVLAAIELREREVNKALVKACAPLKIYGLLTKMKGIGPSIAGRIIAAVGDIRRFEKFAPFKKYFGIHVNPDGTFPRVDEKGRRPWANTRPPFRDAGDMFVKFPDGFWGERLRQVKNDYLHKYPNPFLTWKEDGQTKETVLLPGRWRYDSQSRTYFVKLGDTDSYAPIKGKSKNTPAHLRKKAIWRTVTEFAEWLYWKWRTVEGLPAKKPHIVPPEDAGSDVVAAGVPPAPEVQQVPV